LLSLATNVGGAATVRADQQITLTVWDQFTSTGSSAVTTLYKGFTKTHPNITIRRQAITTDQLRKVVKTALASGSGPDIIYYDGGPGYAGVLAQAKLLIPITSYAAKYHWTTRFESTALQGTSLNGTLYGLPLETDLIGMYYNKTLIDQAKLTVPQTVSQLLSFCTQAKAKGYYAVAFSDNPGWQAFHEFTMVTNNLMGPAAMARLLFQHQGSWNTPQMAQAIKLFFVDMQKAGCFPPSVNALAYTDANGLFNTGKALLNPTGSWEASDIEQNASKYQVGMVPFPAVSGGSGRHYVTGVGSAFFISSKSAHQDAAAQFLDYLFTPQALKVWVEQIGAFPPVSFDTAAMHVAPLTRTILNTLQTAIRNRTPLGQNIDVVASSAFNTEMQNGFQAVLAGSRTPQQEAANLEKAWQAGMKQ
jgi:raffinose/stachyose/melibiose transport system substrate-binding protein